MMKKITLFLQVFTLVALLAACVPVQSPVPGNLPPTEPVQAVSPTAEVMATIVPPTSTMEVPTPESTTIVEQANLQATLAAVPIGSDYKNTTYVIEGNLVTLVKGKAEVEAAPGSSMKIVTQFFGNEAFGDLNGDGATDVAFLLTQSNGGSGVFYFAVAALKTNAGYIGTNAIFLGDRIAPQPTNIMDGKMIFNYADRNPGEPFTTPPSFGVSKTLQIVNGVLTELK